MADVWRCGGESAKESAAETHHLLTNTPSNVNEDRPSSFTVMWFWTKDPAKDFPYEVTDVTSGLEEKSIWTLHKGKKKVCVQLIESSVTNNQVNRDRVTMFPCFAMTQAQDVMMQSKRQRQQSNG